LLGFTRGFCLSPEPLFALLIEETINIESSFLESNEGCREDTADQWRNRVDLPV
jgi:hypothetical protein